MTGPGAAEVEPSSVLVDGPWTHRTVSANGTRLHVAEAGSGPLVVLLHGFPQFWWTWHRQLPALAAAGWHVVAPDLRGYGASDKPPRGYDVPTLAADVAGLVRALGHRDAAVIGHDWGGFVAAWLATVNPDVVRRLALLGIAHPAAYRQALVSDPAQISASRYLFGFQRPWRPERVLLRDGAWQVAALLRAWAAPGWPDLESERRYRQAMRIPGTAHCALEYYRWVVRALVRPDGTRFWRDLRDPVGVPVLQVHGAADRCTLPRTAAGSAAHVTGPYEWRLLRGVGHFPHEEDPEQVTAMLRDWLGTPEA